MHIRYLITNAYGGGGTIHTTFTMANALAQRGHHVEVVSLYRSSDSPLFHVDDAVRVHSLLDVGARLRRADHRTRLGRRVDAALRARSSRLMHPDGPRYRLFNLRSDIALVRWLRSLRGGVLVTTRAGLNEVAARFVRPDVMRVGQEHLWLARYSPDLRTRFAELYPRLDAVVTLTEPDAQQYRAMLGDRTVVRAIPNAVPHLGDIAVGSDPTARRVIAAGRLVRSKGFDLLIDAWRAVAAAHPDWQLRIYGTGPSRSKLERQIERANLGGHVRLMGFTTRLPSEMAASSVFVLSSRSEAFGLVLIEAMACGLPVVSFDCPLGPGEIIDDGVTGMLVENRSVGALAAAIIRLIDDPERRDRLGAAGRQAAGRYASGGIAAQWERLFSDLAARRGRR